MYCGRSTRSPVPATRVLICRMHPLCLHPLCSSLVLLGFCSGRLRDLDISVVLLIGESIPSSQQLHQAGLISYSFLTLLAYWLYSWLTWVSLARKNAILFVPFKSRAPLPDGLYLRSRVRQFHLLLELSSNLKGRYRYRCVSFREYQRI